jgi:hypothetical protein
MFSRLDHDIPAVLFPKDWAEGLKQILLNIYGDKCLKNDKTFEVYGFSYPNEVLMIVSYVGLDKNVLPLTLSVSADLTSETRTDEIQDDMFDFVGVFFDEYFAKTEHSDEDEIFEEFVLDWDETEFNQKNFFVKINRENIALTMAADDLLSK